MRIKSFFLGLAVHEQWDDVFHSLCKVLVDECAGFL
jgi:hypothetical protein